jgi:cytochrome c556
MSRILVLATLAVLITAGPVFANSDPIAARQQLMEDTRDAAKVIGGMLKGEQPFDAEAALQAFEVWKTTAQKAGGLFPEGSESGHDTEAKATIWTDRAGFESELGNFASRVDAALAANPDSLEALKGAAGPVFQACKSCHEGYRVEKEN